MAKFYGSAVKTGKLGGSVFSIRNGEVIERQYQPRVYNPNTPAQIASRARLKLMSQLAVAMSEVIVIPRKGNASSRNLFVRDNYSRSNYNTTENRAEITLATIQLTGGHLTLGSFNNATRSESGINVTLAPNEVGLDIDRVVYCLFRKMGGGLEYGGSTVADSAGSNNTWPAVLPLYNGEAIIYGYGIRLNTDAARVVFGNISIPSAESIARLIVTRNLLESDVSLTRTISVSLPAAG